MKSKDLCKLLADAENFRSGAHRTEGARSLTRLNPIFEVLPEKSVLDVVKRLNAVRAPDASFLAAKLGGLSETLAALLALLKGRSKEGVIKDLDLLKGLVEHHANAGLDHFVNFAVEALKAAPRSGRGTQPRTVRVDLVQRYNRRLEEALGDDESFRSVFNELVANAEIGGAEAAALAKQFAHTSARSKAAAFKKILARHQSLMISRAKSLATAGRIAG